METVGSLHVSLYYAIPNGLPEHFHLFAQPSAMYTHKVPQTQTSVVFAFKIFMWNDILLFNLHFPHKIGVEHVFIFLWAVFVFSSMK